MQSALLEGFSSGASTTSGSDADRPDSSGSGGGSLSGSRASLASSEDAAAALGPVCLAVAKGRAAAAASGRGGGGAEGGGLEGFILENLSDEAGARRARVAALAAHARAFAYPHHESVMSLGTIFSRNVE
jgi:hypothetical protein